MTEWSNEMMEQTNNGATMTRAVAQAANQPIVVMVNGVKMDIVWHQLCKQNSPILGGKYHGKNAFWHEVVVTAQDTKFMMNFVAPKVLDNVLREMIMIEARAMYLRNQ
jgi:hypothetical protein